ncbi:hypothetical protein CLV63_1172 [Murinocardiopsis flavida]|uniref:Post-SET domain-containing protein n=1 Tax=Murinocardiopsis flavida TaxID=645275 RepID=A0A2P8D6G1_9ACTN|nr:SET domain-containing protein-lysine N-methyltransferase [Murinocardiopsis flavida]PSK92797.1 hypothetical protein CLV63_1172 [Murinocardiopsis flavida]
MTEHRYPDRSWLSGSAAPRTSPIEGTGLFAVVPIKAGATVMVLGGTTIGDRELAALTPPYSSLTVAEGRHLHIDPGHPVCFGNHSCDPTLWHADATTVVARRDVGAGGELTVDYATHTGVEGWSMDCRCGSPLCRGVVRGGDWRLASLHRRYGDHWSPPLLDRIREGPVRGTG